MESYVSSLAIGNSAVKDKKPTTNRAIQQAKINAALKGINEALDTYQEDTTTQPYGILIYDGPISNVSFKDIPKPKNEIPVVGHTDDGNTIWVGTVSNAGIYNKIDQSLSRCECVEYYEKTYGTEGARRYCYKNRYDGYPVPYFPGTSERRYNKCTFRTVRCVGGITCIQDGYCECYVVDYPSNAEVQYNVQCNWYLCQYYDYNTCQEVCYWYVCYNYETCTWWNDCHAEYCYRNYCSISDYTNANIHVYNKYKT